MKRAAEVLEGTWIDWAWRRNRLRRNLPEENLPEENLLEENLQAETEHQPDEEHPPGGDARGIPVFAYSNRQRSAPRPTMKCLPTSSLERRSRDKRNLSSQDQ